MTACKKSDNDDEIPEGWRWLRNECSEKEKTSKNVRKTPKKPLTKGLNGDKIIKLIRAGLTAGTALNLENDTEQK